MYKYLSLSERIDRVGALLAKAVYLFNKKLNEEADSKEFVCVSSGVSQASFRNHFFFPIL